MKWSSKAIKEKHKLAFFSTIFFGFVTYFYIITHHFLTYDSMWNQYSDQDMISSGRQFLTLACGISSFYDLPWVNGVLSFLYLALTAVILVEAFQVKRNISAVLIGGLLVTFPSVISTFCYTFTVDGYMLAVLIITLGFYLTDKYKWGFFAGILLTGLSLGIYQAYFSYLILLCIIRLLLAILDGAELRKIWDHAWRYLCIGAGGYLFYIVSLKIMLALKEVEMSGYQGTDKVLGGGLSPASILTGLKTAWHSFIDFARYGNVLTTTFPMKAAFVLIALSGVGIYLYLFIKNKIYRKIWSIVLVLFLLILIPFGSNLISIMAPDSYFHLLMRYSWVVLFVFCELLSERLWDEKKEQQRKDKKEKWLHGISFGVTVCTFLLISQFMIMANIVGFQMNERYEKTYGLCLRIIDRLEQCEGYQTGDEVALLGGGVNQEYYPGTSVTGKDLVGYFGVDGEYCINSTEKLEQFSSHYLNVTINGVSEQRAIELSQMDEVLRMDIFPGEACIKKVDGVWVIRLNGEKITPDAESDYEEELSEPDSVVDAEPVKWYEDHLTIMHAMGETKTGETLTNSREAFEYNYSRGHRVFEIDLQMTKDRHYVLRHDWALDLGQAEAFGWTEEEKEAPDLDLFLNTPIFGQFTPLSWIDLLELMREYEDIFVVTDTKFSHTVEADFEELVKEALDAGYEEELKRVIVQFYYKEMYDEVNSVYPFIHYIFTTYYIELPEAKDAEAFCEEKGIPVLVMPYTNWYDEIAETYSDTSLHVYVHTVNDSETAQNLLDNGVYGIYTDCVELESGT